MGSRSVGPEPTMSDPDKGSSLTVLGGPLGGTRFRLDPAVDEILIGSDPSCSFVLDAPGVSPIHARLWLDLDGAKVYDTRSPRGIFVNDDRVSGEAQLRDGDVLWLGAPGEGESVMIQYRFVPPAPPAPGPMLAQDSNGGAGVAMEDTAGFFVEEPPAVAVPASAPVPVAEPPVEEFFVFDEPSGPPLSLVTPPAASPSPPPSAPALPPVAPSSSESEPIEEFLFDEPEPAAAAAPVPAPRPAAPPAALPRPPAAATPAAPKPAAPAVPKPVAAPPAAPPARAAAKPAAAPAPATGVTPKAMPPVAARPATPAAKAAEPAAPPRPAPSRSASSGPSRVVRFAKVALGAALLLGAGGYAAMRFLRAPSLEGVAPVRARIGEAVTLTGQNFSRRPDRNVVMFNDKPGHVLEASSTSLKVEVPDVTVIPGRDAELSVAVRVGSRESKPLSLAVFRVPRLHGVSPDVGMPGDEIELAGVGWGTTLQAKFGAVPGEVVSISADSILVRVPALEGAPGTSFPITVFVGAEPSNPAPFMLGRLPLISGIDPPAARAGDVVTLTGRGFAADLGRNDLRIGTVKALVAAAAEAELSFVVPFGAGGETPVELRVPGSENVGQSNLMLAAPSDPVEFRFTAEPVEGASPAERAAVGTALGPVFVLAAADGKSAAARAVEAVKRLNAAAGPLKASREADIVARGLEGNPVLGLAGGNDALLEVTAEDAQAYYERQGGRGTVVTPGRLALWWEAIARDLVVLLVRGEKPARAAALAAEGRVLGDVCEAARKTGVFGVARSVVAAAKPGTLAGMRSLALRVPSSVPAPAAAASAAGIAPLSLEREWSGFEVDDGAKKYLTVVFKGRSGTFAYEGGVSVTLPLWGVEVQKNVVRFGVEAGGRRRHYAAQWDGTRLSGTISTQAGSKGDLGNFELNPR